LVLSGFAAGADSPAVKPKPTREAKSLNVRVMPLEWQTVEKTSLRPGEIDRLISAELKRDQIATAPRTTDEQFLRRVKLDLTGNLPTPTDVDTFVRNADPNKRVKLIDALLASEGFSKHWGAYWRDVITSRATAQMAFLRVSREPALEKWLTDQLQAKRS
jgi:hypothetical protein